MTNECCYNIGECKNKVEFWINKKEEQVDWWYPICKLHLNKILKNKEIEVSELIIEAQRNRRYKERRYVNWKMFIVWDELKYHHGRKGEKTSGDIKVTNALEKHRKNNLIKYIKKMPLNEKIVEKLVEIIPVLDYDLYYKHFGEFIPEDKFKEFLTNQVPDLKWKDEDLLEAFNRLIKDDVIETYKCYYFIS